MQTGRPAGRQTDEHTDRDRERDTDTQAKAEAEMETEMQAEAETESEAETDVKHTRIIWTLQICIQTQRIHIDSLKAPKTMI